MMFRTASIFALSGCSSLLRKSSTAGVSFVQTFADGFVAAFFTAWVAAFFVAGLVVDVFITGWWMLPVNNTNIVSETPDVVV